MADEALLEQAEQVLARSYPEGTEAHRVLRAVIDGARSGQMPDDLVSAAAKIRDQYPGTTISLLLHKIVTGSKGVITKESLGRWVAATDAEKRR